MSTPRAEMLAVLGPWEGGWREEEYHNPEGLASDSQGNIYVSDETNHRIQKLDPDGNFLWKVGAVDVYGRPRSGTAPGQFNMMRGVAIDHEDNLWVGDSGNHRIQKFDTSGRFEFMFGSFGTGPGQMVSPDGVAVDKDRFIYVTDTHTRFGGNQRVLKFDPEGHFISSFGEYGTRPGQFAGSFPIEGGVEGPYGIDIGRGTGHLYVADTNNSRIQVFDGNGNFLRSMGEGTIFQPRQLCLDSEERVYIAGFHMPPVIGGVEETIDHIGTWGSAPANRFLWVLHREGELLLSIDGAEADRLSAEKGGPQGLFDHAGGRHHAVTVSRADESLVYKQSGHHIIKYRIHW